MIETAPSGPSFFVRGNLAPRLWEGLVFSAFEKLVHPYPDAAPAPPPRAFFPFLWACTEGLRGYLLAMTLCTALIGAFEALLFGMLGRIVDWLGRVQPERLWTDERETLLMLVGVLVGSTLLVAL